MGAIGEAIVAYAQPLIDETDGSLEQMKRAMALAQMCWNLAILPEDRRDAVLDEMKPESEMSEAEFAELRQHIILPMIQRHYEMFPGLHGRSKQASDIVGVGPSPTEKYPGTPRNAFCPCGSGRKYKRCCGARR